jgi:hypothetical protein
MPGMIDNTLTHTILLMHMAQTGPSLDRNVMHHLVSSLEMASIK